MELGLLGSGPAVEAITAACSDIDLEPRQLEPAALTAEDDLPSVGAVVATTGEPVFLAASVFDHWVAVEVGGIGGHPVAAIDAAVSVYGPSSGCYQCLQTRVAANTAGDTDATPSGSRPTVRLAGAVAGNELIKLLAGDSTGGRVIELPGSERTFLPVPGCECDPSEPTDRSLQLTHRSVTVKEALSRAETAVDDRVGLISTVGERESFPVPYYIAETAETNGFSSASAADFAAGVDADWDRAYMKAIGEGLERYSAGVYRSDSFETASERTQSEAVSPSSFVRPDSFEQPDPEQRIEWVSGYRLPACAEVSLPAEFVYFPPPSRRYRPPITTGLGLGNSPVEALLSGLYEVVERDATMVGWYSTYEPFGLEVDDDRIVELRKRASAESLELTLLVMTQDIDIPVIAAAVHRSGEWPQFAAGSAANLDPVAAAESAAAEAIQNWMELRAMGPQQAESQSGAIATYADFPDAAATFVDPPQTVSAANLGEASLCGESELTAVCEALKSVSLTPYAANITPRDVAELGFTAVRALIPAAQPLFTGDPYFGERAEAVPQSLGFEPRLDRSYHPFP